MRTASTKTLLIVDDEPAILNLLTDIFCEEGYRVMSADDGTEALGILTDVQIDLMVTDEMMPRLSGVELVQWMRERPRLQHVPVILMSAALRPDLDGLGCVSFLPKPFDLTAVIEAVRTALQER